MDVSTSPPQTSACFVHEQPLIVLPSLATAIGLEDAIFLQQVHYWLGKSGKEHDGRRWIYNSVTDWHQQFPFWSADALQRIIRRLEKRGVLLSGNYNRSAMDRTKWYTIDYAAVEALAVGPVPFRENAECKTADRGMESAEPRNGFGENAEPSMQNRGMQDRKIAEPIPETNTETNNRESDPAPVGNEPMALTAHPLGSAIRPGKHGAPPVNGKRLPETECPAVFPVTKAMRDWARENAPVLLNQLPAMTGLFVSYYRGGKGAGTTARNWEGMWQTWMLRQITEFAGKGAGPPGSAAPSHPPTRYAHEVPS